MTEVEQPPQNGIDLSAAEDDDNNKARPADIEQDMREMERRKRVEAIMSSKLFREELERIVDSARDGGSASGILQQLSDIVGMPASRVGSVFKSSNCMMPINDIRGVESMGYAKGEKILRCKLAATFRLLDLYGWNQGLGAQITARLKVDQEYFLVNPYGILYHEITASSLNKVDMQGHIVEQGTTNFGVNRSHFILHSVVHAARPDIRCAIYIGCSPVVAVSSLKNGLLPITRDACLLGEITTHPYSGTLLDTEERDKLVRNLGPNSKVLILANYGALCCGETIEEAYFAACHIVQACETQLKLLPVGLDNLVLIPEESRKIIYEQSRRPPEDLEKKFAALAATGPTTAETAGEQEDNNAAEAPATIKIGNAPKWRVGGAEFEALMRMLDNAGYRTGYIYRHPLIKSDPPKPRNDVEVPPAVSSLGYLLEEEELFKQGIWKKGELRKGGDRSRWLNSPNVYQKVEVLETGTPDPKKITKWVAEGSPTHSTPVRIEDPLQFVPAGTNPKEFKRLQQQIKDNRRADKISAGPQSHILEGVTWDEANRIKDATVSSAGDHVVLMGAASKGIIQRGFQHNATVYKAPYAKNPFDNVTDDELNEYKRTVERKKKSIHGEYTDTDFSESEALSSLQTSGAQHTKQTTTTTAAVSQSEPEDVSEHQVMRIETIQAPVPSQPEVVLSDATLSFINGERSHTATNRKPPTGRVLHNNRHSSIHHMHQHHLKMHKNQLNNIKATINNVNFYKKYAFLYEDSNLFICNNIHANVNLFMIHKIEILPHYTYPLTMYNYNNISDHNFHGGSNSNKPPQHEEDIMEQSHAIAIPTTPTLSIATVSLSPKTVASTPPPYRTVSHYGFNYPLTYLPSIAFHPANLLTAVELQRQKVIEFINSTVMSLDRDLRDDGAAGAEEVEPDDSSQIQSKNLSSKLTATEDPTPADCFYSSTTLKRDDNNGSFISVKEIQLEPKRKRRQQHLNCIDATKVEAADHEVNSTFTATINSADEHNNHEHDVLSEEFSSLLSLGASYPAASHSHSGDLANDHEHEDEHAHDEHLDDHHDLFDDSGDNSSTFTAPPAPPMRNGATVTSSENLYRSYILRNFLPITGGGSNPHSRGAAAAYRDHHDHDIQHKTEAEQALHVGFKNSTVAGQHGSEEEEHHTQHKQIKLTLNSLKRRASCDLDQRGHQHDHHHHQQQQHDRSHRIRASVSEETASCSLSDSSSLKSLEIHINISIKNCDYAKTLHTHEQEFKMKLEKVIDDELNLISQQLSAHNVAALRRRYDSNSSTLLHQHLAGNRSGVVDVDTRSANEATRLTNLNPTNTGSVGADTETDSGVAHVLQAPPPSSLHSASASISSSFASLRHRHTLAVLEHELENLLNGIIRANELHNRAIMCDCKTKISQISDEIRTSLNVGKLN